MKSSRLLAAGSLFASLLLVQALGQGIVTAEQLYPGLDSILKQAVSQSPRMLNRALDLEIAENDRIAARAGLLPSVSGSYRYYESRERRADLADRLSVPKTYYDFSINQPLYHWGERSNNARVGQIREMIAKGNYQEGYRLFAQEVRSQYFRLIIGKIRAKRAAFYLEHATNQMKLGEQRLAQKVISEGQMFSLRIAAERAQIDAERAAFDHENEKTSFARLTGTPVLAPEAIPDEVPAIAGQDGAIQQTLQGFLAQGEVRSNEAINFRHAVDIERLNLANNKTRLLPKFNLVAGVSQDEQRYTALGSKYKVDSFYGGIAVNWTIFDGFSARSSVRSGLARLRQMESDQRMMNERIAQQAQTQARLAGFYARSASINGRLLESAEGNVVSKRQEFDRGVISQEDVNVAQIGLYDMQINTFSSRADYYNQVADFLGTVMADPVVANISAGK